MDECSPTTPAAPSTSDAAIAFNRASAEFLGLLTTDFTGHPELLIKAMTIMFQLRDLMAQLVHKPIPGMDGVNAAPPFEMATVAVVRHDHAAGAVSRLLRRRHRLYPVRAGGHRTRW